MKTERKTTPAALRRGMAFLCTLVLSLMAVTLPASAANQITGLDNTNIGLEETDTHAGDYLVGYVTSNIDAEYLWDAHGTTITGTVKPQEMSRTIWDKTTYRCKASAYSILTITNKSEEDCRLRFSYTVPKNGSLYINDKNKQTDGSYGETLAPNAFVTVKLTTPETTTGEKQSTQAKYTAEVTLQNIELISMNADISVTLKQPTNGSYTAKIGDTALEVDNKTYSNPAKTEYTFTRGAADPNYAFDGWYVNGDKKSSNRTFTTAFTDSCTVEARFMPDPLLSIIQLEAGAEGKKTDYIAVNSDYQHGERSWRREAIKDVKDGQRKVHFDDPRWSVNGTAIQSSASGKAETEWQTSPGRVQALADIYSDVIRVKCLDDCTITFNCKMTATEKTFGSMTEENTDDFGAFLYCYTSNSPNETRHSEFIKGTAVIKSTTNDSRTATVTVNKGQYLYLYAYARTIAERETLKVWGFMESKDFSYSAEISSITVSPNNEKFTFSTQNKDNMGNDLASGTVKVIGANQTSSSWQYNATLAKGTTMTLTQGTAPKGYTFIGWHNVTDKEYDYTNNTYTVTLTRNLEVNPIYVPAMTIRTNGDNGYENATYEYKNLNNNTVTPDGQYVARGRIPNSGTPNFYTDLGTAFAKESTVFLLAGDTITGNLTIPAGKTLVIPDRFADLGPGNDKPEQVTSSTAISSYCKVSYSGKLTVYGKLVVNARQSGNVGGVCGRAVGGIGYLSLSGDSTVTVEKGGELCGYGLIRGGSIFAKDGSVVRELMEISDRRGALPTQTIYENRSDKKVFPYNNYSIKTIESTATYETGATLYAQYSITLDGNIHSSAPTPLFAKAGALFNLTKGTMTKSFDPETRKTIYRLDEDSTMGTGSFSLSLEINKLHVTINTNDYLMPLNAGFDLRTAGDMTMNSSFKFLPGASLSVEKGGRCTVISGADLLFYRLNDYDTRSPGVGEHQKGYSSKAYPVSATKLPDDPSALDLSKIGSARLNVDGEMTVNGGLYVSNDPISESERTLFIVTVPVPVRIL